MDHVVGVDINFRGSRSLSEVFVCLGVVEKSAIDPWRTSMRIENIQHYDNIISSDYNT